MAIAAVFGADDFAIEGSMSSFRARLNAAKEAAAKSGASTPQNCRAAHKAGAG
jgi:hypothetical protein